MAVHDAALQNCYNCGNYSQFHG